VKAFLAESKDQTRHVILLLPTGKMKTEKGDPANLVIELNDDSLRVFILTESELIFFNLGQEVEIANDIYFEAMGCLNSRIELERKRIELVNRLSDEIVAPSQDAWSYLMSGVL
jgi:hypothetical protein